MVTVQLRQAAQRRLVRWTRYQYPTMVVHLKWTKIWVCRVPPSACRHRDPPKVLKNWPRLDEWGTTQFHFHRIPNDSPTSKTQTTDFFSSAITLPDSPRDKGSKYWAVIDDGDTTQNWCQINKLTPYSAKLVTTDKLSAAIQVPDTLNVDP